MKYKQKNFASAVIYVCNAEKAIEVFIKAIYGVLGENFEKFEIICVNDASKDNSKEALKKITSGFENCMVSVLNMSYYQGLEASMRAGVDLAIGDYVFEFDSIKIDYDPNLIMQVYERSLQGFDIVSCGKGTERSTSKLFYFLYNRFSGSQYMIRSETFRVLSRRGINRVNSMSINFPYRKAMYANCGLKMDYVNYKSDGNSLIETQTLKNPHDTALSALILFSNIAYRVTMFFAFFAMAATVSIAVYTLVSYIRGLDIEGWFTTMLFLSGAFFALFLILAIVIKYLSLILNLVFTKQKYVIESIDKVGEWNN